MKDAARVTRSPTIATVPDDRPVIRMERLVNARLDAVFHCWEDPEALKHWWGPNGYTIRIIERDFKPGGLFRFVMYGPNDMEWPSRVVYREVVRNQRIAYTHGHDIDNDPDAFEVLVTFAAEGDQTRVVIHTTLPSMEARAAVMKFGAVELGKQTWDKMADWAEGRVQAG